MRNLSLLLGALLIAGLLSPSPASAQNRTLSETVSLDPNGSVSIDNHEGSIAVTTWDRDVVQYNVEIDADEGSDQLENTEIRVDRSNRSLRLETEYRERGSFFSWGRDTPPVHYTLRMPRTARLTIDDHESEIDVTGLQATLRIDTHEGPIRVADHRGDVTIDSHDGRIELHNVTGRLDVDTHEADVQASNLNGDLDIDAHDGTIAVERLHGAFALDTHDATADVSFAEFTDDVEIDTHDGRVTLNLPADVGFNLTTDFDDATLDSDFDLGSIRIADDDDDEINYRGAVNGGGPRVDLSAHDGRFTLRAQ